MQALDFLQKKSFRKVFAYVLAWMMLLQTVGTLQIDALDNTVNGSEHASAEQITATASDDAIVLPQDVHQLGTDPTTSPATLNTVSLSYLVAGETDFKPIVGDDVTIPKAIPQQSGTSKSLLKVRWDFTAAREIKKNHGIASRTFELPLPDNLMADSLVGEQQDASGNKSFVYEVKSAEKKVVVTFAKERDVEENTTGFISIDFAFALNQTTESNKFQFTFPVTTTENKSVSFYFMPKGTSASTKLNGMPNQAANPSHISWAAEINRDLTLLPKAEIGAIDVVFDTEARIRFLRF